MIANDIKNMLIDYYDAHGKPFISDLYSLSIVDKVHNSFTLPYYKVMGLYHLSPPENRGNHHVYVEVLNKDGLQQRNMKVELFPNDHMPPYINVLDKPLNEAGTNFPLWNGEPVRVGVHGEITSEQAKGMHIHHDDEGNGNTWGHHSFYVLFQLTVNDTSPKPPIEPNHEWIKSSHGFEYRTDDLYYYQRFNKGNRTKWQNE